MRDLRLQFFLTLGILGTVLPYISVFFRQSGLDERTIGYAYATWSLLAIFSPALLTMAADAKVDPRRLLSLTSAVSALGLFGLAFVHGKWATLAVWSAFCAASIQVFPLQDGVHFSQQRRQSESGGRLTPYHMVRVWGTIGFITPSLILFAALQHGMSLRGVLLTGATFAALASLQALRLQDPRPRVADTPLIEGARPVPTFEAARALLSPHMLIFCTAIVLVQMTAAVHSAFYGIYLTEQVKLSSKWLGPASNVAVFIEIFLTLGCGWLLRMMGVKRLLILGIVATGLRMGMIALSTNPWVAVGTQALHGLLIIATGVVPHTIFDNRAGDRFRHSMQGLFVMMISGGQTVASVVAGRLAERGLALLFGLCAAICAIAAAVILLFWKDEAINPPRGFDALVTDSAEEPVALVEPPAQPL